LEDGQIPSSQIIALLTERGELRVFTLSIQLNESLPSVLLDDRIRNLETEVNHLHVALQNLKEEALSIARTAAASIPKVRITLRTLRSTL